MSDSANNEITPFLPSIFENEATGILQDLIGTPALMHMMMFATESQIKAARNYIIDVFEECNNAGHLQVMGFSNEGVLYGYAMIFVHPSRGQISYCHKIFVYEPYRGNGLGSGLLAEILSHPNGVGLLCSSDLVPFYESAGMTFKGDFIAPNTKGFQQTHSMYSGLCMMTNRDNTEAEGMPIFMLNDDDIGKIVKIMDDCKD